MDELNRLAMLAEREVPFGMVFSGSCRDKSQLLRKEYMTFATPSSGDDSSARSEHFTKYDEAEMTPEPSSGSLDRLDSFSVGSAVHGKQIRPTEAPFDHESNMASLDLFDGTENPQASTFLTCDGNMNS